MSSPDEELEKGDKVILVREGLFGEKNTVEEMAKWGDTIYATVEEVERGLRGIIHKVRTVNRLNGLEHGSWFWLEDTFYKAFKFDWKVGEDGVP